ncbi:Predicted pyrophosphatase or phosphodiesterase, AlkP superfamily [Chitinophaga costaii]|uniref:Predicted pyrophosphatase or phosphodiesterase, AlkP superfamily n=1 Tax=Chitinophaga costaii TaxID=1335309 RepID=A0A1C4AXR5_9BACT|nr:ectonucleotide pyrophosphatase/phosphodiesterase [Chitinophaga costaii]PUZ26792.1 alkaline phosphatase family protein [Chitinophaga costaii]SCB99371.1 Predicted pyrophosphatase or phosphodiesterase, AlkP superfamily [Chitinophaga costaii]
MWKKHCITLLLTNLIAISTVYAQDTTQHIVAGRHNSPAQQRKPYVIMISIDGWRYDYFQKYGAVNLQRLSATGVRAASMQPSFPSLTFSNHYTLVTGLYPAHHGLVDNNFYDRQRNQVYKMNDYNTVNDSSWYHGNPLWVLAEKQHMVSASYFWVGSESNIQHTPPTYFFKYNEKVSTERRIQQVVEWLRLPEAVRPHLITFYFPQVDHAGHYAGPDADSTREMVQYVDESIGKMVAAVAQLHLPVNYLVVSDHGMKTVDTLHKIAVNFYQGDSIQLQSGNEKLLFYSQSKSQLDSLYASLKKQATHYTVYRKKETPLRWHYGQEDRYHRIGDVIALADPGYIFDDHRTHIHTSIGHHGYDNNTPEMQAIFLAWGPAFKQGLRIASFANVHVYPLVAYMLGLKIPEPIDGRLPVLRGILKK